MFIGTEEVCLLRWRGVFTVMDEVCVLALMRCVDWHGGGVYWHVGGVYWDGGGAFTVMEEVFIWMERCV